MIGDYIVVGVVFGMVALYLIILHRSWLRDTFSEETRNNAPATDTKETSTPTPPRAPQPGRLRQTPEYRGDASSVRVH